MRSLATSEAAVGVRTDMDWETMAFDYLAGVAIDGIDDVPSDFAIITIPSGQSAGFETALDTLEADYEQ